MKQQLVATFAVSTAVVSTVAAVGLVVSLGQAPSEQRPSDQLAQQTYVDTSTTTTLMRSSPSSSVAVSKAAAPAVKPGVQQGAPLLATTDPTATTTTAAPLPMACGYPPLGTQTNPSDPSAPPRTAAPTPTVTAVFPPDTCPPYVAYP